MYFTPILYPAIICVAIASAITDPTLTANGVSYAARAHWMRMANNALKELSGSPCPFGAFGTVIVNHTSGKDPGDLVCMGINQSRQTGDPSLHGKASFSDSR